jgi:ATP-dependent Clp protease ATP-binding subunit ClpC
MKDKVTEELKRVFRPEFLNRIDGQIVFHALSREHIRVVVDLELAKISPNLLIKGISMEVTDNARDWIGEKGFDPVFGARPLRRVIQNEIEDRLSEALLEGRFGPGDTVLIDVSESGEVVLTKQEAPALASST